MGEFECKLCKKKFQSDEGLAQHTNAKHGESNKEKGKKDKKKLKNYLVLVLLLIAIGIFSYTIYLRNKGPGQYDDLAKCLTEKGAIIYGNDFCQFTARQLNSFGKSERYLKYVKCAANQQLCDSKDIRITPTWEISGKMYSGIQSFEKLAELTGCKL